jgi:hypothetical protein
MSHFYDNLGKLHDCDIREARKNGWVPGTTDIIHTFENSYGLDLYKAKQMFLASLTLPRPEGINDDEFFELVKKDSAEHSERAKNYGSRLHFIIKTWLKGTDWEFLKVSDPDVYDKALQVITWIKENKDSVIVDVKTQETKEGKFKQPYDSWLFQLCGYRLAAFNFHNGEYIEQSFYKDLLGNTYGGQIDYCKKTNLNFTLINIMVSSNENIPIKIYPWKFDKEEWGVKVFIGMLSLYRVLKKL